MLNVEKVTHDRSDNTAKSPASLRSSVSDSDWTPIATEDFTAPFTSGHGFYRGNADTSVFLSVATEQGTVLVCYCRRLWCNDCWFFVVACAAMSLFTGPEGACRVTTGCMLHNQPCLQRHRNVQFRADVSAVVADFGTATTKIGYAGSDVPVAWFPTVSTHLAFGGYAVSVSWAPGPL